jgi:hypothetical protein
MYIHRGRLEVFCRRGEVELREFRETVAHGHNLLRAAGLRPLTEEDYLKFDGEAAPWAEWRLVISLPEIGVEREIPPVCKSFREWLRKYHAGE